MPTTDNQNDNGWKRFVKSCGAVLDDLALLFLKIALLVMLAADIYEKLRMFLPH